MFSKLARWSLVGLVGTIGSFTFVGTAVSHASSAPDTYSVTLAARTCPTYTDISANKSRNDIMESLKDLGPDTTYANDDEVSPSVEAAAQPNCTPLVGWHFTFGNGIAAPVSGTWGSLSVVSNPESPTPPTKASVPLLDANGNPTGQNLEGAVTVTLTAAQVQAADQHNLWLQGGLATDPVENAAHPDEYGFGALRCAQDNVNGDNVEWVGFRAGERHVFCYAYYVVPPPSAGTIIITKAIPAGDTNSETFNFSGNLSYNPGGAFGLTVTNGASASTTFTRGASATPWTVSEDVPVNWTLQSLDCVSTDNSSTTTISGPQASITLAAGDTVHCTYTDAPTLASMLTIRKISLGGTGTFPFTISSTDATVHVSATTTSPGVAVDASPTNITAPGTYTINEDPPTATGGTWRLLTVQCNGVDEQVGHNAVTITITQGAEPVCTFVNDFVPDGSITIFKVMKGGLGTADFVVTNLIGSPVERHQSATPPATDVATKATGDATTQLPLGRYAVQELVPAGGKPVNWSLVSLTCQGASVAVSGARATLDLTPGSPSATCTYTDRYASTTDPVAPPSPVSPGPVHVTG